jgi:H+/Cl- antiporter ClcA
MKQEFAEESVIFAGIIKWLVLSTLTGALVGLASAFFLKILNWSIQLSNGHPYYFVLLPAGLSLSIIVRHFSGEQARGLGAEIEAVHKHEGRIKPITVPLKLIATVITIATGGSAGKEGPCAEIGAGLSSIISDIFKLSDNDRKKLVICGISAGLAAVFGAPVSGSVFGVEVLSVGSIMYDVLMPSLIAGITAYHVSSALGIQYFSHKIDVIPVFSEIFLIKVIIAGLFFGICSFVLIYSMGMGKTLFEKIRGVERFRGIIGGIFLIALTFMFSTQYLGLGLTATEYLLTGGNIIWYAFIIKIVFTAVTFGSGGSGGVVTPIFFIGAAAGTLFAHIFKVDPATFSALGALALMAGATNTPIAASIMAMELFGTAIAPYATVACLVSFLMTGHRSIYPYQLLAIKKSHHLNVELGAEMENVHAKYDGTIDESLSKIWRYAKKVITSISTKKNGN